MDLQEAKKQMRDLLSQMLAEHATELLLMVNRVPQVKVAGKWKDWDADPMRPLQLDELAQAITKPEQWKDVPTGPLSRRCTGHLLALGIGRFKVDAIAHERVFSLAIQTQSAHPPAADATVPFVPADRPPSLSAEAVPEI